MSNLSHLLAESVSEVVQRVQRSLVVLQNGHHGIGAGIIWKREGIILTNYHVVAHGRNVQVLLHDGSRFPAHLFAQDREIDLALLRIEEDSLQAALIADSRNLRVGELVMAIGHPWGQRGMVTVGLVSGLGEVRTRGSRGSVNVIRSDARLAPGNSGGPLLNANGAVIGINTMIVGGDQGIAIPSHIASAFVIQAVPGTGSAREIAEVHDQRSGIQFWGAHT